MLRGFSHKGNYRKVAQVSFQICQQLVKRQRFHSNVALTLAGLQCSNDTDSAHCQLCGIQVSTSKLDTEPMDIHAKRSPT
ncbi:unnamed protein product, partial [Rotaria socialis]